MKLSTQQLEVIQRKLIRLTTRDKIRVPREFVISLIDEVLNSRPTLKAPRRREQSISERWKTISSRW